MERVQNSSLRDPAFSICCRQGKVVLDPLPRPPDVLYNLYTGTNIEKDISKRFLEHIRTFNTIFSFTSTGCQLDLSVMNCRGPPTIRIHGEVYHTFGTIFPGEGRLQKFAQLYIQDTEHATTASNRIELIAGSIREDRQDRRIVDDLQEMMMNRNPYAQQCKSIGERIRANEAPIFGMRIIAKRSNDPWRYNAPTAEEVAAILPGDGSDCAEDQDIVVQLHDNSFKRVSIYHLSYYPMAYPLPLGSDGFRLGLHLTRRDGPVLQPSQDRLTMKDLNSYRLQLREGDGSEIIFRSKYLFMQFIVDMYAATEMNRLTWCYWNQKTIRAELYQDIQDAIHEADTNPSTVGHRTVLPSSFTSGPQHMVQLCQDVMAIVCATSPDYFITFTCNPAWLEILEALFPGQVAHDRLDLLPRVFNFKFKDLMRDLTVKDIFGKVVAFVSVVEFQKRGLPHAHILLTLAPEVAFFNGYPLYEIRSYSSVNKGYG